MRPELIRVDDDITCVRRPSYFTCSYVWRRDDGVVLIDAGMKSDGSDVLHALDALALDVHDVRAVFLTHWHNDHAAGAQAIVERSGTRVFATAAERPWLERETAARGLLGAFSDAIPEVGPLVLLKGLTGSAPMVGVTVTDVVDDGARAFGLTVLATPGHTEGHAAYFAEDRGVLFAGDALALVDGRLRRMAGPVTPDRLRALASMRRVVEIPFVTVCPGHREPGTISVDERARFLRSLDEPWPLLG